MKLTIAVACILLCAARVEAQSEGHALHVFVGKSVVINMQAPVTRVLSSNPDVIGTLANTPTQIVVEGKAPGQSSLTLWDHAGHSQILDVTVRSKPLAPYDWKRPNDDTDRTPRIRGYLAK